MNLSVSAYEEIPQLYHTKKMGKSKFEMGCWSFHKSNIFMGILPTKFNCDAAKMLCK